ncbi:unnamed protein product [Rhizophagus irregularis]|nr:unnamed protein product [Rhizophagus irregularis]
MSYKFESDAIKAFEQLLLTEIDYNVIINIGEKSNFREFHAHSNILRCRSHHFNKILSVKNIEKKDEKYVIKYPNISPKAFSVIIKYLYTGHINVDDKTGTELLDIMIASDELKLEQLTKLAEDFILENHHQFLRSDPVGTLQIVYYNKSLVNLQEFCLETICFEPKILFNSDKFINLPAPLLEIILKRDDLNLPEIEVWENLIKWGLAQRQTPNQHVSKWASRDGGTPEAFHKKCDNKDRMNIKTGKLGYSNGTKSIGCYPDYGPVFGGFFYCIDHNTWTINNSDTYTNIDGIPTGNLKTDDYEVFQIVKKKVTKNTLKKKTEILKNDPDLDDEGNLKADKISEEDREREEKKSSSIISLFKKTK